MLQFAQMGFPEMYERALVDPLFRPWAEDLVSEISINRGNRVLDIACGTGVVARMARLRVGDGGTVVGVDVNPTMLRSRAGSRLTSTGVLVVLMRSPVCF